MNITIGTPMYGGMCYGSFMTSIFGLYDILKQNGHDVSLSFLYNESLIQRGRNKIANLFLKNSKSDVLLFIDADIDFNPTEIYDMLMLDKDIIGAVVPLKGVNYENIRIASFLGYNTKDLPYFSGYFNINGDVNEINNGVLKNKPFKVDRIGAAVLAIKKNVLNEMSKDCETYRENSINSLETNDLFFDFFPVKIEDNILMSEDFSFCNNAKELGYNIYATSVPIIGHSGTYKFNGNLYYHASLIKKYDEIQKQNR